MDDDKRYCETVRDTLDGAGFRVLVAWNALEALRINRTHPEPIHLALIDIAMPLMDGWRSPSTCGGNARFDSC